MSNDKALLLSGANTIEIDLAKSLLSEAGIPCVVEGPDFDVAELGRGAHDMIRGQDLFVLADRYDEAKAVLDAAWEDGQRALVEMGTPPPADSETNPKPVASRGVPTVTLIFAALTVFFGYKWMRASSDLLYAQRGDPHVEYSFEEDRTLGRWIETEQPAMGIHFNDQGNVTTSNFYDRQGILISSQRDRDGDGLPEFWVAYDRQGAATHESRDLDGDGRTDLMTEHRPDETKIEYLDEDRDGFYEQRTIVHKGGRRVVEVETSPGRWACKDG